MALYYITRNKLKSRKLYLNLIQKLIAEERDKGAIKFTYIKLWYGVPASVSKSETFDLPNESSMVFFNDLVKKIESQSLKEYTLEIDFEHTISINTGEYLFDSVIYFAYYPKSYGDVYIQYFPYSENQNFDYLWNNVADFQEYIKNLYVNDFIHIVGSNLFEYLKIGENAIYRENFKGAFYFHFQNTSDFYKVFMDITSFEKDDVEFVKNPHFSQFLIDEINSSKISRDLIFSIGAKTNALSFQGSITVASINGKTLDNFQNMMINVILDISRRYYQQKPDINNIIVQTRDDLLL